MKLSAIMLTGHRPERRSLALVAVECFRRQTFPPKDRELVILNCGASLGLQDANVREHLIHNPPGMTLGDMRNHALELARGEWVIQWDDDDWYHEERCEAQMSVPDLHPDQCVTLGSQIRHCLVTGAQFLHRDARGIYGTILHHREVPWRYLSRNRGEDAEFIKPFKERRVIRRRPTLYCRLHHGYNTWGPDHIMKWRNGCYPLDSDLRTFVSSQILPSYRFWQGA